MNTDFYNLSFRDTLGNTVKLEDYKGKLILIVNTATKCGLTPQLTDLEALNNKYKDRGFVVLGFPCNQFGEQEPETNETVVHVCNINYGVTFLLSEKIEVNGEGAHDLYVYLKNQLPGDTPGGEIEWNFAKFLINTEGVPVKRYKPTVTPLECEEYIVSLLPQ